MKIRMIYNLFCVRIKYDFLLIDMLKCIYKVSVRECFIGIPLLIHVHVSLLNLTNTSFWRFALHCQKKSQGPCRPHGDWKFYIGNLLFYTKL
jgi:hypothetical protein